MPRYDFRLPRLHVPGTLSAGNRIALDRDAANYLRNVLRLGNSDTILLFNGRDGEWRCALEAGGKRELVALPVEQVRPQPAPGDLHYLFAPIKHARLDYMVQKAVELGVSRLQPVVTQHTQVARINLERMRANVIEAAQQCGILSLPDIVEPIAFDRLADAAHGERTLVFCDEDAETANPVDALARIARPAAPLAVLVGPEGGFSERERATLLARSNTLRLSLGPRILRADTAAVAALTLVQAVLGDWARSAEPQ